MNMNTNIAQTLKPTTNLFLICVSCRIIYFIATIYDSIVMQTGARRVFSGFSKLSGSTFGIVHNICILPNDLLYYDRFL